MSGPEASLPGRVGLRRQNPLADVSGETCRVVGVAEGVEIEPTCACVRLPSRSFQEES